MSKTKGSEACKDGGARILSRGVTQWSVDYGVGISVNREKSMHL
jgi:hypothetical protein